MRSTLVTLDELKSYDKEIQYSADLLFILKENCDGNAEFQGYVFKIKK